MGVYWLKAYRKLCNHSGLDIRGRVYCIGFFPNDIDFRDIECRIDKKLVSMEEANQRLR